MYQIVNILIIVFVAVCILRNKGSLVKFKLNDYLLKLGDAERKELAHYLKGFFIIGLFIPALVWAMDAGGNLLMNKLQQTKVEQVHAYEYIGRCYVIKDCRHIVLKSSVQTDEDVVVLTGQIKKYMISQMQSEHKKEQNY
jgi:hypothetical protein